MDIAALKRERDRLYRQSEEDWVQLVIWSEWSHGYLQMSALMVEAKAVSCLSLETQIGLLNEMYF